MKNIISILKKLAIGILNLILIYIILLLVVNFINFSLGGKEFNITHTEKLIPIALSISISIYLFSRKLEYIIRYIVLSLVFSSVFILLFVSHSQILFKTITESVAFNCSLALFVLTTVHLFKNSFIRIALSIILTLLTLLPSILFWLYYSIYKSVFTTDSLIAIMQTNYNEATEFIHGYVNFSTIVTIIISLSLCVIIATKLIMVKKEIHRPLLTIIVVILSLISGYSSFNNVLTGPIVDFTVLQNKYGNAIKYKDERLRIINQNIEQIDNSPGIYILVIGESHNKLYNSTYNYKVNSTPWLKSMETTPNLILFNNAYSNYTQTVQALTYALTLKNQYNSLSLDKAPSLIEIANVAGYKTVWLSNQGKFSIWDTGVSLIANEAKASKWVNNSELRVHSNDKKSNYDGSLIPELKNLSLSNKMLIVIHLYGSHSTYEDRFPKEYAKFHGLGDKNVDDYVNSIYYNDHIMHEILDYAKTMPNFKGLLYFSDHSEAVNHGGHSATNYRPDMVCIPMYMYFSDSYIKEYPKEFAALKKAQDYTFTNDLITNTMLSIMHIKLKNYYEPDNDLANPEYNHDFTRFRTLYGRAPLTDWHTLKPE